jgi:glucoamylase
MPRDIPVGNGKLLITFDQDYCLRDIYFPHVGRENHTVGHKFRFGIWVEEMFSWIMRKDWRLNLDYKTETLLTDVTAVNDTLGLELNLLYALSFFPHFLYKVLKY